jgi:hypothetical protein
VQLHFVIPLTVQILVYHLDPGDARSSLLPTWLSLDVGGCFRRGMNLNGSGWVDHGAMVIDMNETRLCALEQLRAFLEGTGEVRFQSVADDEGTSRRCSSALPTLGA